MEKKLRGRIFKAIKKQVSDLVDANEEKIVAAYEKNFAKWVEDNPDDPVEKFKFSVGMKAAISPKSADEFVLASQLSFSVKHTAKASPVIISNQGELFGGSKEK